MRTMRDYSGVTRLLISATASALLGKRFLNCLWELTYRCTAKCAICNYWRKPSDPAQEVKVAEIRKGLDKIFDYGCRLVNFTGGEPLLRRDLEDIVAHACNLGMWSSVVTNGTLLTAERILALKNAGLDNLLVSLDSLDSEIHDQQRGIKGSHDKVIKCMEWIRDLFLSGHRTGGVMCVLSSMNLHQAEKIVEFADKYRVYILFQPYHDKKTGNSDFNACLGQEHLEGLLTLWKKHKNIMNSRSYIRNLGILKSNVGASVCHAGRKYFSIDPYGYLHPCVDMPPIGHILRDDVSRVRSKAAMDQVRSCSGCWYCFRGEADTSLSVKGCWEKFALMVRVIKQNSKHRVVHGK